MTLDGPVEGDTVEGDAGEEPTGGPRTALVASVVVGVLVLLMIAVLATRDTSGERVGQSKLIGGLAPEVAGPTIDGTDFDMDSYRGRWVVVNFFAQWCIPCQVEHPELVAFQEDHAARGDAAIVAVVFDDKVEKVVGFFERNGGDWPVLRDDDGAIRVAYGVAQVPESFIVAPDGTVLERLVGGVTTEDLDAVIDAYTEAATRAEEAGS